MVPRVGIVPARLSGDATQHVEQCRPRTARTHHRQRFRRRHGYWARRSLVIRAELWGVVYGDSIYLESALSNEPE